MADSLWTLPFGKYKGKDIEEVPNWYLHFLLEQDWFVTKFSDKTPIVEKELDYRERFDITIADLEEQKLQIQIEFGAKIEGKEIGIEYLEDITVALMQMKEGIEFVSFKDIHNELVELGLVTEEFTVNWGDMLSTVLGEFDVFTQDFKTATDAIDQLTYFAVDLEQNFMASELLIRTQNKMRCSCMSYANEKQRNWIIQFTDAIFDRLNIKI